MTERPGRGQARPRLLERGAADRRRPGGRRQQGRLHDSPHEECAVEIATQVAARRRGRGDRGDPRRQGRRRAAAQRTRGRLHRRRPTSWPTPHTFGPADIAREIAAVVKDHEAAGRTHDLVLLGSDAADSGDFQVGIRLAYELGRPVVNGATTVTVEDGVAVAVGKGPEGQETYRVPLPAVVTIREGGVEPRYPSVKGRMAAKKVPDRGAHRRPPSRAARSGSSCCCRRRPRAACRSWARAPRPRPPSSTSSSSWGCWPDDPGAHRDRPRRHRRPRSRSRRSPSPATCPPRAAGCRSTPSSSTTCPMTSTRSWRRTACATCTGSAAATSRRTPAPAGPRRS